MTHYFGAFLISFLVSFEELCFCHKRILPFSTSIYEESGPFHYKPQMCTTKECHNTQHITRQAPTVSNKKHICFCQAQMKKTVKLICFSWKFQAIWRGKYESQNPWIPWHPNLQVKKNKYPPVNKHSNGKSPSWIGNTSSNGGFSIAMLDCRRVLPIFLCDPLNMCLLIPMPAHCIGIFGGEILKPTHHHLLLQSQILAKWKKYFTKLDFPWFPWNFGENFSLGISLLKLCGFPLATCWGWALPTLPTLSESDSMGQTIPSAMEKIHRP